MKLEIDFETRSECNLNKCGAHRYSEDPTTEVMCMAIKVDDGPTRIWVPAKFRAMIPGVDLPFIDEFELRHLFSVATEIHAHNAFFEVCIYRNILQARQGFPPVPDNKWYCTMAQCLYHSLPGKLETAGKALGLPLQKDDKGHRVMLQVSKPRKPTKNNPALWWEDAERLEILFRYCITDVDSEDCIGKALAPLPPYERKLWLLDLKINMRGIGVDHESVKAIIIALEVEETHYLSRFVELSGNTIQTVRQAAKFIAFLQARKVEVPTKKNDKGETIFTLEASAVETLLEDETLDPVCREMLQIKQRLNTSATSKFNTMEASASLDGRIRGTTRYHKAHTGRWAGALVQPHNMKRPELSQEDIETTLVAFKESMISYLSADYKNTASSCVRAVIMAGLDKIYACSDFKAIEGRVLAWLADDRPAVQVYIDGKEPYVVNAQALYNEKYEDVSEKHRLVGKVEELSLGYGGGEGAFVMFADAYKLDLADIDVKHTIRVWRGNRQITVDFWYETEKMFLAAVMNPGEIFSIGIRGVSVWYDGKFLYCRLPSGRIMHYFKPEIRPLPTPWGDIKDKFTYMGVKAGSGHWTRLEAFYGVLVENLVQAIARDILSDAMFKAEEAGFPIVLHVHDEILAELENTAGTRALGLLETIMSVTPTWAPGLPMGAAGWMGMRYQK